MLAVAAISLLALPTISGAATGDLSVAQCFDDDDTGTEAACTNQTALDGPEGVAVSPDGRSVYVASLFEDAIVRYDRNPATGALTFVDCFDDDDTGGETGACTEVPGLNSVNSVEVSPDGASLYASSNQDNAVVNFNRNQASGALTFSECLEEADSNFEGTDCPNVDGLGGAAALTISADGRSVYAGSANDDAVVNFNRNPSTGTLSFLECFDDNDGTDTEAACAEVDGLNAVTSLDSTTDGRSVYALSNSDHAIVNFDRNPATGALTFAQCLDDSTTGGEASCASIEGLTSAANLAVSDDGHSLYAAALGDDAIVNLDRNPATGVLSFSQCVEDNDPGVVAACTDVDGLNGAIAVAISADGSSVYAASQTDNAIVNFDRDPASGDLTFSQCFDDNDPGTEAACTDVDGLDGADVKVSPDGRSVIAASLTDDAVVNFSRDPGSGPLAFGECFDEADTNPEAACTNVDGLADASAVAVSADGTSLYASSFGDDAIVNFDRDPATGALSFAQCFEDDESSTEPGVHRCRWARLRQRRRGEPRRPVGLRDIGVRRRDRHLHAQSRYGGADVLELHRRQRRQRARGGMPRRRRARKRPVGCGEPEWRVRLRRIGG